MRFFTLHRAVMWFRLKLVVCGRKFYVVSASDNNFPSWSRNTASLCTSELSSRKTANIIGVEIALVAAGGMIFCSPIATALLLTMTRSSGLSPSSESSSASSSSNAVFLNETVQDLHRMAQLADFCALHLLA